MLGRKLTGPLSMLSASSLETTKCEVQGSLLATSVTVAGRKRLQTKSCALLLTKCLADKCVSILAQYTSKNPAQNKPSKTTFTGDEEGTFHYFRFNKLSQRRLTNPTKFWQILNVKGTKSKNQNRTREKTKSRLNSRNFVQNPFAIKINENIILNVVLHGCKTWSLHCEETTGWRCLRRGC
jgi:hypothetical protein